MLVPVLVLVLVLVVLVLFGAWVGKCVYLPGYQGVVAEHAVVSPGVVIALA